MRVLFALPGLHRIDRGAEIAFISVAKELANAGATVTLIGSGQERAGAQYRFLQAKSVERDHFQSLPSIPVLRNDCAYEELTFVPELLRKYRPADYDVTLTCSYPFTNWVLRRATINGRRPPHVFVTQNGDWPATSTQSEYRFFGCEGLVCTNPDFFERNKARWNCKLIPNGVDCERFQPGPPRQETFGLPKDRLIVLMVSALIPTKRVEKGIEAVSRIPGAHLVVAGNGPLRETIIDDGAKLLPDRFSLLTVPPERMPALYQSANVFLHLSKDEPFGNVFLEAMACGVPVVAHDSPRTRWIVGNDQFLTDSEDPEALAKAIVIAANARHSKEQQRVAQAASFSWKSIGKSYQDFLEKLAS